MSTDCLFCKIARGEVPCREVYSDERVLAFHDINPVAPKHILVIPRRHIERISDVGREEEALIGHLMVTANEIAEREGLVPHGYRYVVNCGADGLQSIYHLHLHLLGGRPMSWPPG